jgi:hypothetical protein
MWRLFGFFGALTFMYSGCNIMVHGWGDCEHVRWGHQGTAKFGTFTYECMTDRQWRRLGSPDSTSGPASGCGSFAGGLVLMMLAILPGRRE